jgi:hypothetical protein
LRQRIDALNDELIDALARNQPRLSDPVVQQALRQKAAAAPTLLSKRPLRHSFSRILPLFAEGHAGHFLAARDPQANRTRVRWADAIFEWFERRTAKGDTRPSFFPTVDFHEETTSLCDSAQHWYITAQHNFAEFAREARIFAWGISLATDPHQAR